MSKDLRNNAADAGRGGGRRSTRRSTWVMVAALLSVVGVVAALALAGALARADARASRQTLQRSSADIASTLELAIEHENDLVINAGGYIRGNPTGSQAAFSRWADGVQVLSRYPELQGLAKIVIVSAADLPAYTARAGRASGVPFVVKPAGARPFYCFTPLAVARNTSFASPSGTDVCAREGDVGLLAARDSGRGAYAPVDDGAVSGLGIQTPVFAGGRAPATVAARRANLIGWVGVVVDPKVLLIRALQGHPGMSVSMRYRVGSSDVRFASGRAASGAQTVNIALGNGWTVQAAGTVTGASIFANGNSVTLLIAIIIVSLLLAILVYVLGTGRLRALRLADSRTAELRGAQSQLVDTARQAGMAEIATNVLHNVGNVLNSVNVSANLITQKLHASKLPGLNKAVTLIQQHNTDLGTYITADPRGQQLPPYLTQLSTTLTAEHDGFIHDLQRLTTGVSHIKEIVKAQQTFAGVSGVIESAPISDLIEDALRISGATTDTNLTIIRDYPDNLTIPIDRHRTLLILLNLITNAQTAMANTAGHPRELHIHVDTNNNESLTIAIADNGTGIPTENLDQIFIHGFTTHTTGHGFGLHSSAIAATEMGGTLTANNTPHNTGAIFTLHIPLNQEAVAT